MREGGKGKEGEGGGDLFDRAEIGNELRVGLSA